MKEANRYEELEYRDVDTVCPSWLNDSILNEMLLGVATSVEVSVEPLVVVVGQIYVLP